MRELARARRLYVRLSAAEAADLSAIAADAGVSVSVLVRERALGGRRPRHRRLPPDLAAIVRRLTEVGSDLGDLRERAECGGPVDEALTLCLAELRETLLWLRP